MGNIRKFQPFDLPQVIKIAKISFPKNRLQAKNFENYYQLYPEGFLVAEELGEIIGFAIGQFKDTSSQINLVAVNPPCRQGGVGSDLVNSLTAKFKDTGFKEMFLHVRTDSKEAVSFFEGLGFRILNTDKKYYQNKDDAFLMAKSI
jgi:ribosomal-protein-alanine acetyltransferase